ncbi:hypothetical protein [Kribbella steppae]|uniref:hypothetical protein n=1 Tax=Kribbella steppae TaxID=2512223 RepID=UPI00104920D1|nr:hypothetical protein [Kribbella steppae]
MTKPKRGELVTAARILFCLRIVRPSFRAGRYPAYPRHFRLASGDPLLDKFFDHVAASPALEFMQRAALVDVTGALTVFGITLRDLTPEGLLHCALEARKLHHGGRTSAQQLRHRRLATSALDGALPGQRPSHTASRPNQGAANGRGARRPPPAQRSRHP